MTINEFWNLKPYDNIFLIVDLVCDRYGMIKSGWYKIHTVDVSGNNGLYVRLIDHEYEIIPFAFIKTMNDVRKEKLNKLLQNEKR